MWGICAACDILIRVKDAFSLNQNVKLVRHYQGKKSH